MTAPLRAMPPRIQSVLRLWFMCLLMFSLGRLYYAIDYRSVLMQETFTITELIGAFVSAIRFDISVATMLITPLALMAAITQILGRKGEKLFERFTRIWVCLASVFCIVLILVDHYFYIYFKDHFNVFFWEFWENLNNSTLVIDGLGGVLPVWQTISAFALGGGALRYILKFCVSPLKELSTMAAPRKQTAVWWMSAFVALPIGWRATFEHRPLTLQNFHEVYSQNDLINLLHTNPLFPLIRAHSEYQDVQKFADSRRVDQESLSQDLQFASTMIADSSVVTDPQGFSYLNQNVQPTWQKYLVKRPKHVVLIVMESYSAWPMKYGGTFGESMSANMKSLINDGLYFDAHFPSSGGTIKNLLSINYSFAVPRDFSPALLYHKEAYKKFPGLLPRQMRQFGFEPHFYYAGLASWHRLYQFVPKIGYEALHSSVEFDPNRQHKHGSFDDAMFSKVDSHLQNATTPQFLLLMSLTNHPPFNLPPEVANKTLDIPKEIRDRLLGDESQFYDRFRAFQFADQALGQFISNAKKQKYFADTLFVITGDHGFGGAVTYPPQFGWKEDQVPLVFYAPHLLRKEFVSTVRHDFSTHVDIAPTLAGLLTDAPIDVPTWGRNILAHAGSIDTGINFYFSCQSAICLKRDQIYQLDADRNFRPLGSDSDEQLLRDTAKNHEKSYYNSALGYFYGFKD